MRVKTAYKMIASGALISLLCVFAHNFLPNKRLLIYPSNNFNIHLFALGGQASWVDQEQLHWRCEITAASGYTTCGIAIEPKNAGESLDLSSYETAAIQLKLKSPEKRVRMFLKSWLGEYSQRHDDAQQHSFVTLRSRHVHDTTFSLRQFSVPEWWLELYEDLPTEYSYPSLNQVRTVGIDLGSPIQSGQHEAQLERLEFVGQFISAESLYRGLLIAWFLGLSVFASVHYLGMRQRLERKRRQLERLAQYSNRLKDESATLKQLSMVDSLTGALNRHGLQAELVEINKNLPENQMLAVVVIDLDHFKAINDHRGHDVGDLVLKTVAEVLRQNLRGSDRLARWGGEEFVVVCPHLSEPGSFILAEKLRQAVANIEFAINPPLQVTASFGVFCCNLTYSFEEAFKRADEALCQAKSEGRNRTVIAG